LLPSMPSVRAASRMKRLIDPMVVVIIYLLSIVVLLFSFKPLENVLKKTDSN
jgi:predicted tellurium resistance membrane protein TerC